MTDPINARSSTLTPLSEADYEVAPNEPDVRGWNVVLGNDETIGEVDDLIIDPSMGKVRYLEVDLDTKALALDRARRVLVPISSAQLDNDEEEVILSGLSREALLNLPDYDRASFSKGSEHTRYDETFRGNLKKDFETKRITRAAEELQIDKRAAKTGEVRVSKHVETEHVRQSVPVQREEVRVQRRPVERAVGSAADMRDDEIVVPVIEEEVVVEKRPVVKEEVVVSKAKVAGERTVEADLRREEVDVTPSSNDVRVKDDRKNLGRCVMADIDVVPKQRSLTWLWVLVAAAIVIALLIWVFAGRTHTTTGLLLTAPLASAHIPLSLLLTA